MAPQDSTPSRRFLAPAIFALMKAGQVAAMTVSTARPEIRTGFAIEFDDLRTNVRPSSVSFPFQESVNPKRIIRYDGGDGAGLGDRMTYIAHMLSIATNWKATLAFTSPKTGLSIDHGISSADWWNTYFVTVPSFVPVETVQCVPNAQNFTISSGAEFDEFVARQGDLLHNSEVPLCISLTEHLWRLVLTSQRWKAEVAAGAPAVSMWTSSQVAQITMDVQKELRQSSPNAANFNAMHVRLGDMTTVGPACRSAEYVAETVYNFSFGYPEFHREPWLLMSDGDDQFFADMERSMPALGLSLVSEHRLKALRRISDNYLKYAALECAYAGSDLAVMSYKNIGLRCRPEQTHAVKPKYINCAEELQTPMAASGLATA